MHFSPAQKKCEGHPAVECESARALQLIRAERPSNGSCQSCSSRLRPRTEFRSSSWRCSRRSPWRELNTWGEALGRSSPLAGAGLWVGVQAQACLQVLPPRRLPTGPSVHLCTPCATVASRRSMGRLHAALPCLRTGCLRRGSGAARNSTAKSLPFLWLYRRQHGPPEGAADFVGSDMGCDWLLLVAS